MTRRLLESARGVIVHSRFMVERMREQGFAGPVARIPHGAWIPAADRNGYRHRLGLDESTPLIGVFGFLKPYKRIAESLRAFRRLVRLAPAGEDDPGGRAAPRVPRGVHDPAAGALRGRARAGLRAASRISPATSAPATSCSTCATPPSARVPAACCARWGWAKPCWSPKWAPSPSIPDDVCLKVPVGAGEEDLIFEYLNLLVSRPDVARDLGERARRLRGARVQVGNGSAAATPSSSTAVADKPPLGRPPHLPSPIAHLRAAGGAAPEYVAGWAAAPQARSTSRRTRRACKRRSKSRRRAAPGTASWRWAPTCRSPPRSRRSWATARCAAATTAELGRVDRRTAVSAEGERFECDIDLFDAEKDVFPYPDGHFSTVLCCELIEHLFADPMHMMGEINRILKPGGHLVLTTPNIAGAARHFRHSAGLPPRLFPRLHPPGGRRRNRRAPQPRVHAARDPPAAGEFRLRGGAARNRAVPRRAASRIRLGDAPARALSPFRRPARRRHLRRGQKDRTGARALSGVAVRMNARYTGVKIGAARGARVRACFDIRNESYETWRAAEGFAVGVPPLRRRNRAR